MTVTVGAPTATWQGAAMAGAAVLLVVLAGAATVRAVPCTDPVLCKVHDEATVRAAWQDVFDEVESGTPVPNIASPCWRDKAGTAHCLPAFIVAGVAKCGTTDLFQRLKKHPQLRGSRVKEPHWLTRAGKPGGKRYQFSMYMSMWDGPAEDIIKKNLLTFEASASTFWDRGDRNTRNAKVLLTYYFFEEQKKNWKTRVRVKNWFVHFLKKIIHQPMPSGHAAGSSKTAGAQAQNHCACPRAKEPTGTCFNFI